jgi:hypothetical protein
MALLKLALDAGWGWVVEQLLSELRSGTIWTNRADWPYGGGAP